MVMAMEYDSLIMTLNTIGKIVTVLSCIICPIVAASKGRSVIGWFFGGLLLGGIGIIIVSCLSDKSE